MPWADGEKKVLDALDGDVAPEIDDTLFIRTSTATAGVVLAASTLQVVITNDGAAPAACSIRAASQGLPEGNGGVTAFAFEVSRAADALQIGKVTYRVSGASDDFAAGTRPSGPVALAAVETFKVVEIGVAGDAMWRRTRRLPCSSPTGAVARSVEVA